jgi:hypothetical protein
MPAYVDVIVTVGSNHVVVNHLVHSLADSFPIKDLGVLSYFLDLKRLTLMGA